jgi:putative effector of murein hydrolase LrgA (UPF0299 family)
MEILFFFVPVVLVVAQYFTSAHVKRSSIAREAASKSDSLCA